MPFVPPKLAALVALTLSLVSCNPSGAAASAPPAPAVLVGDWSVKVKFTRGNGTLASLVDTEISGQLTIARTALGYTITDGATVEPLTVTGNQASFSYTEVGVTQTWTFTVSGAQLAGYVLVLNEGNTAEGTLTGARTQAAEHTQIITIYETEQATVVERLDAGPGTEPVIGRLAATAARR